MDPKSTNNPPAPQRPNEQTVLPPSPPVPERPVTVPPREASFETPAPRRTMPAPTPSAPRPVPPYPQPTTPTPQVPIAPKPVASSPTVTPTPQQSTQMAQTPASNQMPTPEVPHQQPKPAPSPPQHIMQQAAAHDHKRALINKLRGLLSLAVFVMTVIVAAMLINSFVFQSYYVDGTSMTPTLQNEDRLIIDKASKTAAAIQGKLYIPNRGEIVVLDSAILDQYGHEEQLIKRVIGLPGDTIIIKAGVVTIKNKDSPDGFNVDQQLGLNLEPTYTETPIETTVPQSSVYVLGDNRGINGSFDSRSFGMVASQNIQGRLAIRIFPFNRTRFF